jgi:hypothetical protein
MSTFYVTSVTNDQNISTDFNVYLIDATNNSVTLTLPQNLSDGIGLKFKRIDSNGSNTVTINPYSGDTIVSSGNHIILSVGSNGVPIISYNGSWYTL